MPKTCVIIPHLTGKEMLGRCLAALARQTEAHTVYVVAQGTEDGSRAMVAADYPKVRLLSFDNNAGFAGGVNRALRPAIQDGFDYLVLLNNDAVAEPEWLAALVRAAEAQPEAGIVTSKILRSDGKHIDSTGDFFTSWGFSYPRGRDEEDKGQYDGPESREIFSASGGASLYKAKLLKEIGLFDEKFFAYYEDVDISFRAQLAGYSVRFEPTAVVKHEVNATSSKMKGDFARYHTIKNFIYLYTKNMPGGLYWKYLPKFWVAYLLFFARDVTKLRVGAFLRATGTALVHLPEAFRDRRKIQAKRKVDTGYIDSVIQHEMPPSQRRVLALKQKRRNA